MKLIKPFRALRPPPNVAPLLAAPPYDVLSRAEAVALARGNPVSFLHVNRPEVDLPADMATDDRRVYEKGAENFREFIARGHLRRDKEDGFYIYRQELEGHVQTGLVAIAAVAAYEGNVIKKHELTRPAKENDRVRHMAALGAQVGPVFLTYRASPQVDEVVARLTDNEPEYDFAAADGSRHVLWVVDPPDEVAAIEQAFAPVSSLYVADGHHRSAAACRVRDWYREGNPAHTGDESYNHFLVVAFPHDQLRILDYNRLLLDLNGHTPATLLASLEKSFTVTPCERQQAKPQQPRHFGLYLEGRWHALQAKASLLDQAAESDPVGALDVSLLQDHVIGPLFGIADQRTDKRIDFVGGVRGLVELDRRVREEDWQAAIALHPTSVESLMAVADAGQLMPPKSTWFEPKLKSGLLSHVLD